MTRLAALATIVVAALLVLAATSGCSEDPPMVPAKPKNERGPRTAELEVAGRTIEVELACTPTSREMGLKHRTGLSPDSGMLFIFPDVAPRRFWMKDTLIGLDIMFLDDGGKILNIEPAHAGVEQPGYMSRGAARFVLEMEKGWAEAAGLKAGDRVEVSAQLRGLAR